MVIDDTVSVRWRNMVERLSEPGHMQSNWDHLGFPPNQQVSCHTGKGDSGWG